MKKFVKPLVIAASVAAVVGVGAVSFAKWTGGTKDNTISESQLGSVIDLSWGSTTAVSAQNGLVPYDQGRGTTVVHYALNDIIMPNNLEHAYVTVKVDSGFSLADTSGGLYVLIDKANNTAPDATKPMSDTTNVAWKKIETTGTGANAATFTLSPTTYNATATDAETLTGYHAHVILVSDDNADNKTTAGSEIKYTLTLTLSETDPTAGA